jgi:hypothetical protein
MRDQVLSMKHNLNARAIAGLGRSRIDEANEPTGKSYVD